MHYWCQCSSYRNKVIPERSLVLGSPGKVVRQVTDEEIEHIKENARDYVENFKKYEKFFENNAVIINQNKRLKIINKSFSKILEKKV